MRDWHENKFPESVIPDIFNRESSVVLFCSSMRAVQPEKQKTSGSPIKSGMTDWGAWSHFHRLVCRWQVCMRDSSMCSVIPFDFALLRLS